MARVWGKVISEGLVKGKYKRSSQGGHSAATQRAEGGKGLHDGPGTNEGVVWWPAGPTGKLLLMPEDPNSVFIMVATGTGIAPFRSFWRRQFFEDIPNYKFTGLSWLFMGVANSDAKLYDDELQEILATYPDQVCAPPCPP